MGGGEGWPNDWEGGDRGTSRSASKPQAVSPPPRRPRSPCALIAPGPVCACMRPFGSLSCRPPARPPAPPRKKHIRRPRSVCYHRPSPVRAGEQPTTENPPSAATTLLMMVFVALFVFFFYFGSFPPGLVWFSCLLSPSHAREPSRWSVPSVQATVTAIASNFNPTLSLHAYADGVQRDAEGSRQTQGSAHPSL